MSVLAAIEPKTLKVEPGGSVTATIRVRNQSERVDGFRLEVLGSMAAWATIEPALLQLFPRTEGETTLTFSPPRSSTPRAGSYPFAVRALSVSDKDASVVEEGDITVGPFVALQNVLEGRVSRGWRTGGHRVIVRNTGNTLASVSTRTLDPEEELSLAIDSSQLQVGPEGSGSVRTTVRRKQFLIRGAPKRWPYSIEIREPSLGAESLSAVFEQRPLIPGWLIPVAGVLIAAVVALAFLSGLLDPSKGGTATQTPGASQIPAGTPAGSSAGTIATPQSPADTAPTETPVGPTITIEGYSGFDGAYPVTLQYADVANGIAVIHLSADALGTFCDMRLFLPTDGLGLTSAIGTFGSGPPYADFVCGSDARFSSKDGSYSLDRPGLVYVGMFSIRLTDGVSTIRLQGTFTDAGVNPS